MFRNFKNVFLVFVSLENVPKNSSNGYLVVENEPKWILAKIGKFVSVTQPILLDVTETTSLKMKVSVISRCSTRFVYSQRFDGPSKKGIGSRVDTTSDNVI